MELFATELMPIRQARPVGHYLDASPRYGCRFARRERVAGDTVRVLRDAAAPTQPSVQADDAQWMPRAA